MSEPVREEQTVPVQFCNPKNAGLAFCYYPPRATVRQSSKLTALYAAVAANTTTIKLSCNAKNDTFTALRHYLLREPRSNPFPGSALYEVLAISIYLDLPVAEILEDLKETQHAVPDKKKMEKFMAEVVQNL